MSHPQHHLQNDGQNKHANYNYAPVSDETSVRDINHDEQQRIFTSVNTGRPKTRGWLPVSLSIGTLGGFAVFFSCCLTALVLLRIFADRTDGFALLTKNHYSWTYGPTAILIIVISFWRQVEYHSKALVPWSELHRGPAAADRTVLLDHVSPFQLVTLYCAGTRGHASVVAAITGFLVLKLVTIASTGLLFPATVAVISQQVELRFTSQIDNDTALTWEQAATYNDPSPAFTAWAILERGYSHPQGVTDIMVYETFELANTTALANVTFSAEVNAFVPHVECTHVRAQVMTSADPFSKIGTTKYWDIRVLNGSTWTCPNSTRETYYDAQVLGCDIASRYCPSKVVWPTFGRVPCNRTTGHSTQDADPILLALSELHYNQTWNHTLTNYTVGDMITPSSWRFSIPTMKALLCQPSYSIQRAQVTYNMSGSAVKITATQSSQWTNTTLRSFATRNLTDVLETLMSNGQARDMFGNIANDIYLYAEQPPNSVMKMISSRAGGDYQDLLDDDAIMLNAAEEVLTALAIQSGRKDVLRPATASSNGLQGQQTYTIERLKLQPASVYVMEAGFAAMILVAIMMIFVRPVSTGQNNPETTKALSTTLLYSTDLRSPLQQLTSYGEKDARQYIRQDRYYTRPVPRTGQQMICSEQGIIKAHNNGDGRRSWWSPITLSIPFLTITLCTTLALIGVLEGLQHFSDASQGLGSVDDATPLLIGLYTRFLPALITLLVATMFNSLDFNTAMLAPFSSLRSRAGDRAHFGSSLLAYLPPVALYHAFRRRYWTACISLVAAIIGSGLTIVVSGLYTVQNFQNSSQVAMKATDSWNMSIAGNGLSNSATAAVSSLVESANLSYPAFTYGDLVFPTLAMVNLGDFSGSSNNSGFISVRVPALRAELSCTDYTDFNFTTSWNSHYNFTQIYAQARVPLPLTCQRGGRYGNLSHVASYQDISLSSITNTTYFGFFSDLHVGPFGILGAETGEYQLSQPDNPPECPTILLTYGYGDASPKNESVVTMKYCYQHVKAIETNVTLSAPSLTISSDYPPVPDESTAQLIGAGVDSQTGFPWRIQADVDSAFVLLNQTGGNSTNIDRSAYGYPAPDDVYYTDSTLSNFYVAALFGKTPMNVRALADMTQHPQVFNHLQQFYGRYMAQALSANMRIPANSTTQLGKRASDVILNPSSLQGTFTPAIGSPRLIQNRTPKLILQIMLGTMFLCGSLVWIFGDLHRIVPWNPCTIAGTMVLFAGSKMCYPLVEPDEVTCNMVDPSMIGKSVTRFRSLKTYQERDDYVDRDVYELRNLSPEMQKKRNRRPSVAESQRSLLGAAELAAVPSATSREGDGEGELDHHDEPSVVIIADQSMWDHPGARFRLGWWRDGTFMGTKLPPEMEAGRIDGAAASGTDSHGYLNANGEGEVTAKAEKAKWRYGIDVLS